MTRDDIIRMAREAGMPVEWLEEYKPIGWGQFEHFFLAAFAAGEQAEREACAQLCDRMPDLEYGWRVNLPSDCAAAIRARGEKK